MSIPPTLDGFLRHPDHPTVSAFTLGLVTLLALQKLLIATDTPRHLRAVLIWDRLINLFGFRSRETSSEDAMEKGEMSSDRRSRIAAWVKASFQQPSSTSFRPRAKSVVPIPYFLIFIGGIARFSTLLAFRPTSRAGAHASRCDA
jgi:hypothetical protein